MIYAVIPFVEQPDDFEKRLEEIDGAAYTSYAPKIYFVRYQGTAQALSEKVGFNSKSRSRPGIVIGTEEYFGFGNVDLWKWLER